MSLIQTISARREEDLLNEGARVVIDGTVSGAVSGEILLSIPENRFFIVTGYHLSSSSGSSIAVNLSLTNGSDTFSFFTGFLSTTQTASRVLGYGDWIYGALDQDLVMDIDSAGDVSFTIDGRVSSSPTPLGYIEQIGVKTHSNPVFPPDSGLARGQSEF